MRILIVEDDASLASGIAQILQGDGHAVDTMKSGEQALLATGLEHFGLVILDIGLPGIDGFEVLRKLRSTDHRLPVLVLTARDQIEDRVHGLELGADDYMVKPFAMPELVARVRALLRRSTGGAPVSVAALELGGVRFDFLALTAESRRGPVELTGHDILVLKVLAERRGEIVPRIDIVEEVSGLDSEATLRKVDNHVVALRRAIGDDPRRPRFIHTVRGSGYRLAPADNG